LDTSTLGKGDIVEAIAHLSESLRIFRMKQGLDSLDASYQLFLYHLGRIYGKKAEYEKSLSCFNESLRIRRVSLPSNHGVVVDTERFVEAIKRKVDSLNN
jgi:tetratricopeptide (TPR) repeat protein